MFEIHADTHAFGWRPVCYPRTCTPMRFKWKHEALRQVDIQWHEYGRLCRVVEVQPHPEPAREEGSKP